MTAYIAGFMTHVTGRLTGKNLDQLRNPTLGVFHKNQSTYGVRQKIDASRRVLSQVGIRPFGKSVRWSSHRQRVPKSRLQLPQLRPYIVGYGWWDEEAHLCEQFVEGFYLKTDQPGLNLLSRKSGTLTTTPQIALSDDSDKYISVYLVLSLLLRVLCFPHCIAFFLLRCLC